MKRPPSSESSPLRPCDKKLKLNDSWTSKYGPGDYTHPPTELLCESPPPSKPTIKDLGYKGKFSVLGPDHVVLGSIDGPKFSVAKAALVHSSGFFASMFELDALTAGSQAPIPVLVPADGLFTFLVVVEDRFIHRRENKSCFHQSTCIRRLSIKDKLVVQELADRFDCEGISARLKLSIDHYYASSSGLELLAKASEANLLVVAKIAIGKLGADQAFLDKSIYRNWWTLIKGLRPGWQVELTRLVWKNQYELVNRPNRLLHPCGRRVARKREVIMVQTASSWAAIAAAFNPPKAL